MPLILNIETATQVCSIGLSEGNKLLAVRESHEKNIHAASVTVFTEEVLREAGRKMQDIEAVAVSMGPGSYTGLRIGVSAAKGMCYALAIPLIAVPTLQAMALRARSAMEGDALLCPMIDARRMEVYTAIFDQNVREVRPTEALIIDDQSFDRELEKNTICYFGDGAEKCRDILDPLGMIYLPDIYPSAREIALLAAEKFTESRFEDVAYFEPYYLKDFIAGKPKVKGLQ